MSSAPGDAALDLIEYRKRDAKDGRFRRYARARVRQYFPRQVITVFGAAVTAIYIGPELGLFALVLALLGETIDSATLWILLRFIPDSFKTRWADRLAAVTGMFQATCFSVCIGMGWIFGGLEAHMFALTFFLGAAINGGLTANFHLLSAVGRSLVYFTAVSILLVVSAIDMGVDNTGWQLTVFAAIMLIATIVIFLGYLLRLQANHMKMAGDILAQKARIADALQTKTRFLSSVSHQLRTPLNGILGASDLLMQTDLRENQRTLIAPLRSSASDLHALISDILDITQLEKGGLTIDRRIINFKTLLNDILERYRRRAEAKGLDFNVTLPANLPKEVLADPDRIRQILAKLLANAIQYTQNGQVDVSVTLSPNKNQSLVFFRVEDTGSGMSKKQLKRLFSQDPLQADALDNGLGLGLRISQKLARQMGGNLLIDSVEGQGTTCRLTLEVVKTDIEKTASSNAWTISDAAILIAEDNKTNQLIVKKMLDQTGADLCFANDGVEAVERYHSFKPDLILMDLAMPHKSGLEATKDIRSYENQKDIRQTPIIALTANAFDEDKRQCEQVGMNGFLSKPVNREVLISELTRAGQAAMA